MRGMAEGLGDNGIAGDKALPQRPEEYSAKDGVGNGAQPRSTSREIEVKCGPLLNYKRMSETNSPNPVWHGSVLIVTTPGPANPELRLQCLGPVSQTANGHAKSNTRTATFGSEKLYEDPRCAFWRFLIDLPLQAAEMRWEYHIPNMRHLSGSTSAATKSFVVPSATQSMRIMFHSCNGFSVGTDEDAWSGCALWSDVLRKHEEFPVHVMIGGGDQIYNDGIRITGPLRPWTDISNPHKRREFPFDEKMRAECDEWYLQNYIRWFSTEPFSLVNGIIPQLNIWDDHDIIDGFGSYTDHFMKCAVFRGIGGVAHKYYLLFQHHIPPSASTFTTSNKSTMDGTTPNIDPAQLNNAYVAVEKHHDPSYVLGKRPGPYVEEHSMSLYTHLGAHIAFLGIDARTERTRHQINYEDTYDLLFQHAASQIRAAEGRIKHLILLLGVPIAYPRLQWLENILTSPIIGPVRFLSKRFGVGGGLFNNFDGNVDLLDDLDDHYTAHQHKRERKDLMHRVQRLAESCNVRVTILGGDVHLGAFGRFYSNPRLNLPVRKDHRYMANIISSAITNKPPPQAVANVLARRNKIHHLDHETDETLLNLFDHDPGFAKTAKGEGPDSAYGTMDPGTEGMKETVIDSKIGKKTADKNNCTMPSRNYALLTPSFEFPSDHEVAGAAKEGHPEDWSTMDMAHHNNSKKGNPRNPIHRGEEGCGTGHPAASGVRRTGLGGRFGIDVAYRVEIDNHNREGRTQGYGLTIPTLEK